jgi:hypothetical protein
MKKTQNNHLPLNHQKGGEGMPSAETIQKDLHRLSQRLQARARSMQKKGSTLNERAYWKTQGRLQILWRVSALLHTMQTAYPSPYACYLALKEYLDYCLEKCDIDAQEESDATSSHNTHTAQQWKAEGEAQELPTIREALSALLRAHAPSHVDHVLSLNGKRLLPLRKSAHESIPSERVSDGRATGFRS